MGSYIAGQEDYPVSGVSWYEAAAYARWAGKSLPTIYHWSRAADPSLSSDIVPLSNFGGRGPLRVGAAGGLTRGGTTDMAGNVKEWCLNARGVDRYILDAAWSEPVYMFNEPDAQSPFAREATHGFRCIKVDRPEHLSAALTAEIASRARDPRLVKPVSGPVFEAWRSLYSFDHGGLNVKIEGSDDSSPDWRAEKVSYAAAYGGEAHPRLSLSPKEREASLYQVVVVFPGANALYRRDDANDSDFSMYQFTREAAAPCCIPFTRARSSVATVRRAQHRTRLQRTVTM